MASRISVNPNTSDSHQTSPGYVLTFLRWANRDLQNYDGEGLGRRGETADKLTVRNPLVVVNDCVYVSTSSAKASATPSVKIVLLAGDLNYMTAIAPGDFVCVNMLDYDEDAMRVRDRALGLLPINRVKDGFKGVFKVRKVSQSLQTDPESGQKRWVFVIEGFGFSEWQNRIYFNKYLVNSKETGNDFLFMDRLAAQFASFYGKSGIPSVQRILKFFITVFLGNGFNVDGENATVAAEPRHRNQHYLIPQELGKLLSHKKATHAVDIYDVRMGVEKYRTLTPVAPLRQRLNPTIINNDGSFFEASKETVLPGKGRVSADYWSNVPVWNILSQQYLNGAMNEIFTSYRVSPVTNTDDDIIMPTVVIRQKPFTSEAYGKNKKYGVPKMESAPDIPVTRFFDLPRWVINPERIYSFSNSRSDEMRVNFVQLEGRVTGVYREPDTHMSEQIKKGNYDYVKDDVIRSGLKPYMLSSNFDFPSDGSDGTTTPAWAKVVSDWVIGQHLKLSGSMECVGFQEPISIGDNIEFDNVVYHIESITHSMSLQGDKKVFRTQIGFSNGVSLDSNADFPVYGEMDHTDAKTKREEDYNDGEGVLPGFSDTQDIPMRVDGEEVRETPQKSFSPSYKRNRKNRKD